MDSRFRGNDKKGGVSAYSYSVRRSGKSEIGQLAGFWKNIHDWVFLVVYWIFIFSVSSLWVLACRTQGMQALALDASVAVFVMQGLWCVFTIDKLEGQSPY